MKLSEARKVFEERIFKGTFENGMRAIGIIRHGQETYLVGSTKHGRPIRLFGKNAALFYENNGLPSKKYLKENDLFMVKIDYPGQPSYYCFQRIKAKERMEILKELQERR
ncbi:MAG: hypothetical protein QXT25_04030 [Candidatus Anstonellaceae archaeon]